MMAIYGLGIAVKTHILLPQLHLARAITYQVAALARLAGFYTLAYLGSSSRDIVFSLILIGQYLSNLIGPCILLRFNSKVTQLDLRARCKRGFYSTRLPLRVYCEPYSQARPLLVKTLILSFSCLFTCVKFPRLT